MEPAPSVQGAPPGDAVAGRISAEPGELRAIVDAWLDHLLARGRTPSSVAAYRRTIEQPMEALGWSAVADVSTSGVYAWIDGQRASGAWTASTYNRNLSALRGLCRYMVAVGAIDADPLAHAERALDDRADGARASTTEEARRLVAEAVRRQTGDRRAKGDRGLYWACLFGAGLRLHEPARWRWRALLLDESVPVLRWEPGMHKARRLQEVAIAPELAGLLREHRGTVPHGADDPVFPVTPSKGTFRADRDAAGIAVRDSRGRGFSAHSARKWFETTLARAGVNALLIGYLMRHAPRVQDRYYDPTPGDQAGALALLPRVWPGEDFLRIFSQRRGRALRSGGETVDTPPARPWDPTPTTPPRGPIGGYRPAHGLAIMPGGPSDRAAPTAQAASPVSDPGMAIPGLNTADVRILARNGASTEAVAGLLESIARILRGG